MKDKTSDKKTKQKRRAKSKKIEVEEQAPAAEEEPQEPLSHQLLRLQADFDNFRKRTMRERDETYKRANEHIMEELLPVLDHMDLALAAVAKHGEESPVAEGFKMVSDQMLGVLGKFGLEPIDASGKEFDPDSQEAISQMPSPDTPENVVIEQLRKGYRLGDKLLRAAQVVVSCGKAQGANEGAVEE